MARRHVDAERIADHLADIKRLEHGDFVIVFFDQRGKAQHDPLLLGCGQIAPAAILERNAGGLHGIINIGCVAIGDFSSHRAIH